MKLERWRMAAGVAVLGALALAAARLLPAYLENLKFQQALENIVQREAESSKPDDAVRAEVVNAAAGMGLPVSFEQVRVKRAERRLEVQALYVVPVDLPMYTVDLHFRPRARVP